MSRTISAKNTENDIKPIFIQITVKVNQKATVNRCSFSTTNFRIISCIFLIVNFSRLSKTRSKSRLPCFVNTTFLNWISRTSRFFEQIFVSLGSQKNHNSTVSLKLLRVFYGHFRCILRVFYRYFLKAGKKGRRTVRLRRLAKYVRKLTAVCSLKSICTITRIIIYSVNTASAICARI